MRHATGFELSIVKGVLMSRRMKVDILVVGGGVAGLASALAMRLRGFSVAVLDAGELTVSTMKKNARVYAINTASQALFKRLGVWQLLPEHALSPYQGMQISDASNQASIAFEARDLALKMKLGLFIQSPTIIV